MFHKHILSSSLSVSENNKWKIRFQSLHVCCASNIYAYFFERKRSKKDLIEAINSNTDLQSNAI